MRTPQFIASLKQMPNLRRAGFGALLLAASAVVLFVANTHTASARGLAAPTNLAVNGSFEIDGDLNDIPDSWAGGSLTPADKRVCNQSYAGHCSFKFVGDGTLKQLTQFISVSGSAGDEFTFKVWTKGKNIVNGGGAAAVYVQIYYPGSGTYDFWYFETPAGTTPWTLHQLTATATAPYDSIGIIFQQYSTVTGKIWLDKVKLIAVP